MRHVAARGITAAALIALPTTACAAEPVRLPVGTPMDRAGATPSPVVPTATEAAQVTPSSVGQDRRGDLVRGRRTLTGTVERSGTWLLLTVGERRWALTGAAAEGLTPGTQVRVSGQVTAVPAGCPADSALEVTRAVPAG